MSRCHGSLTRKLDSESQADLPVTVTAGTGRIARRRTVTVTASGLTECPGPRPAATQSRRTAAGVTVLGRGAGVRAAGLSGPRRGDLVTESPNQAAACPSHGPGPGRPSRPGHRGSHRNRDSDRRPPSDT